MKKRIAGILVTAGVVFVLSLSVAAGEIKDGFSIFKEEATSQLNAALEPGLLDKKCALPYTQNSIWNVPINWKTVKIHTNSDAMVDAILGDSGWIGSDVTQFTANVYFVNNKTPLVPVTLWQTRRFRDAIDDQTVQYGQPGESIMMPLPKDAKPAPGTDAQLVVINLDTGEEWGIIKGQVSPDGVWSAGGAYRYHIGNSGVPPAGFGQRGAGIGQFAGIIRPCEVKRGSIDHAVTVAFDYPCAPEICRANGWPEFIPPFTKTDGRGLSQYAPPEGARLVIRPEIKRSEINKVCAGMRGCIVWVLAMQNYGAFIVDNSGHAKTYAEGDATAHWDPKTWSADMLKNIPASWYAVLDWNSEERDGTQ